MAWRNELIRELEVEIEKYEKEASDFCPIYLASKMNTLAVAKGQGGIKHMAKEYVMCYQCDGKNVNCQIYRNHISPKILS